jgi:hypothetical protein
MKRFWTFLAILMVLTFTTALAQEAATMPRLVADAHFIYVTTFDGPSWSTYARTDDLRAIGDVEAALRAWGKYMVVSRPSSADIILVVQKHANGDTLGVYRGHASSSSIPLWRVTQKNGLDPKDLPLVTKFRKAVEALDSQKR